MSKSTHFFGQPKKRHRELDEETLYYRFYHHITHLECHLQGGWETSKDGEEKRRH